MPSTSERAGVSRTSADGDPFAVADGSHCPLPPALELDLSHKILLPLPKIIKQKSNPLLSRIFHPPFAGLAQTPPLLTLLAQTRRSSIGTLRRLGFWRGDGPTGEPGTDGERRCGYRECHRFFRDDLQLEFGVLTFQEGRACEAGM